MTQLPLILPAGTQVVTRIQVTDGDVILTAGTVGIIIKSPVDATHAYRVRFLDGGELSLKRDQLAVRSHHQNPTMPADYNAHTDLYQYVMYRCVIGSRAYGLDNDQSDTDLRGIYLPTAHLQWSLFGVPDQLERGEECYWEMEKFITLALKANPNILECLYTPLVEHITPLAQELLDMRRMFVTKLIYQTYNGYVMSQFRKLQKDIENYGEIRWKHAMHLIRLLLSGMIALQEGDIPVRVPDAYRPRLLVIRHGEMAWDEVNEWRLALHKQFDEAFQKTSLPERPNYELANDYLIRARRSAL